MYIIRVTVLIRKYFFVLVKLWKCLLVYSFVHVYMVGHNKYGYLE